MIFSPRRSIWDGSACGSASAGGSGIVTVNVLPLTVLYAPTWEGWTANPFASSLPTIPCATGEGQRANVVRASVKLEAT